jgi:hypothetical protein
MAEFTIRSESVDVEQIMRQIRSRIREKRGVDYTEDQIRELATVRLEKFLDPKNLRSDLLEQFRKSRPALPVEPLAVEAPYTFDDKTLFASHRGALRFIRKLLKPLLMLFFNSNTLNQVLHAQAQFNVDMLKRDERRKVERAEWNVLYYEVLHNLVLETTRMSIEVKNMRMRLESLSSRLDFSERRVRALEGVVQYRPEAVRPRDRRPATIDTPAEDIQSGEGGAPQAAQAGQPTLADGTARRRRRRRRGRRGSQGSEGGAQAGVAADESNEGVEADTPGGPDGGDSADVPEPLDPHDGDPQ